MSDIINPVVLVDRSLYFIIGFSFVFLFAVTLVMIYFVIRYRRSRHPVPSDIRGNWKLEVAWIFIPTLIALAFASGNDPFALYSDADAYSALMEKIGGMMIDHKDLVKTYWTNGDALLQSMRSGEVFVAMAWDNGGWKLHEENPDIDFIAPKSGALGWIDTFALPAKAENLDAAYKWINFMLTPENAAIFTNLEKYGTASQGATALTDPDVRGNFERSFSAADIDNIKWYPPVPAKLESIEGKILDKVKAAR